MKLFKNLILVLIIPFFGILSCDNPYPLGEHGVGISSKDKGFIADYEKGLTDAGIPYKVVEQPDGEVFISWDIKYSEKIKSLQRKILGLTPEGTKSLCGKGIDPNSRLKAKLEEYNIPYGIQDSSRELECIYWDEKYDDKVAEVYSNYAFIRKDIKKRKEARIKMQSNKSLKNGTREELRAP